MDWMINLGGKISGATAVIIDLLPLLGAVGSILGVGATIAIRASACGKAGGLACVYHAAHPTLEEAAIVSGAVGLLKAHFNHQANAAAIAQAAPPPVK